MNGSYEALCRYFQSTTKLVAPYINYIPSPLDSLGHGIEQLVQRGVIDATKPFLDAGSGDGRVVALASLFGLRSVGVDYNDIFCDIAKRNIEILIEKGALNGNVPTIIGGNFESDGTYERHGMRFKDFGTVYNFQTKEELIAEKIARQSSPGTVFLLLRFWNDDSSFKGLVLEEIIELPSTQLPTRGLYVYRRRNRKNIYMRVLQPLRRWFQ